MRLSHKPVRKCHRCSLNLGKVCALFDFPRDQWGKRMCVGYLNEELLKSYEETVEKRTENDAKVKRQLRAKQSRSVPHYDGHMWSGQCAQGMFNPHGSSITRSVLRR